MAFPFERVSASKLRLARKCVYPWTSGLEWDDKPLWSARIGTAVHYIAETGNKPADWGDLTDRQREIATGMAKQYTEWAAANYAELEDSRREVAYFYDPATGEVGELPKSTHRDYSKAPPGAFTATLDIVCPGSRFDYVDIKTGWAPQAPAESDQMRFQGFIISRLHKLETVNAGVLALREKSHFFMPAPFSGLTLDIVESELQRVHLAIKNNEGPRPGDWCKTCPVKQSCSESTFVKPTRAKSAGKADGTRHAA